MRAHILILILIVGWTMEIKNLQTATFAGGCFWCMEAAFETLDGVDRVVSGYKGGDVKNPIYEQVSSGTT